MTPAEQASRLREQIERANNEKDREDGEDGEDVEVQGPNPAVLLTTATPAIATSRPSIQAEPLLHWSEPVTQVVGLLALFLAAGAVGFRYAAVRNRLTTLDPAADPERTVYARATQPAGGHTARPVSW